MSYSDAGSAASKAVIVIPCLNEAAHLRQTVSDLFDDLPIWIIDGGSTDGSVEIGQALVRQDASIRLVANPGRTQARALNLAARLAKAEGFDVMIRADAHAHYAKGWASGVQSSLALTGADSVVVPLLAAGTTPAALLQTSWLGTGGARHRGMGTSGWVLHGHHAGFRLDRFLVLGGYDERFDANEDVEFDLRLTRAGGRIWMAADLPVGYLPRQTATQLARQMHRNGRWRVLTARKHGQRPGLRQCAPIAAGAANALGLLAAALGLYSAFLVPLGYFAVVSTLAARRAVSSGSPSKALPVISLAITAHHAFALGALGTLIGAQGSPRATPHESSAQ